jgi:hypothetical protein
VDAAQQPARTRQGVAVVFMTARRSSRNSGLGASGSKVSPRRDLASVCPGGVRAGLHGGQREGRASAAGDEARELHALVPRIQPVTTISGRGSRPRARVLSRSGEVAQLPIADPLQGKDWAGT